MNKLTSALALALVLAAIVILPIAVQAATPEEVTDVAQNFMCQCGCGAVLPNCLHTSCAIRDQMNATIAAMLDQGKSQAEITAYFVAQYGEQVLASPPKKGFNLTAWITPFVAIVAGGVGLFFLLRAWTRRGSQPPVTAEVEVKPELKDEYRQRLEKELNEFRKGQR